MDVWIAAADAEEAGERGAAQQVAGLEQLGRGGDVNAGASSSGANDVQLRRVGRLLLDGEEGRVRPARVSPQADRRHGVEPGRLEADGGPDAVQHEAGNQGERAEGVLWSVVVGRDDRPLSAESLFDERKLDLVAVPQCVRRIRG